MIEQWSSSKGAPYDNNALLQQEDPCTSLRRGGAQVASRAGQAGGAPPSRAGGALRTQRPHLKTKSGVAAWCGGLLPPPSPHHHAFVLSSHRRLSAPKSLLLLPRLPDETQPVAFLPGFYTR